MINNRGGRKRELSIYSILTIILLSLTSISGICEGVQERGDTKYKGGGNGDVVLYGRIVPTYPPSKTPVEDCERGPLLDITFTKVDGKDISRKFQVGGAVNLRKL